jgi:hypothetical protein
MLLLLPMLSTEAKLPMLRMDAALATDSTLDALSTLLRLRLLNRLRGRAPPALVAKAAAGLRNESRTSCSTVSMVSCDARMVHIGTRLGFGRASAMHGGGTVIVSVHTKAVAWVLRSIRPMKNSNINDAGQPALQRDPDEWKTGDEPMTAAQRSYLETLCRETGEEFDDTLSKADASKRIDELRQRSPRLAND